MPTIQHPVPATRSRLDVVWLGIPVLAAALGVLGLGYARTLRAAGSGQDQELLIAVIAAGACLAVAGWWVGGLLMLVLAAASRRLRWHGLERWASRLTPALVARTAVALVGVQLVVVAPAHADDAALDPFWAPATAGTEQLSEPTASGPALAAPEGATPGAVPESAAPESVPQGVSGQAHETIPGTSQGGAAQTTPEPERPEAPVPTQGAEASTSVTIPDSTATAAPTPGATGPSSGTAGPAAQPANPPAGQRVSDGVLTVMAGDTLWDLTEQLLGPGATDTAVCQNLPAWLKLNTVAHHGDLIRPGDQLRVPPHLLAPTATPHQ